MIVPGHHNLPTSLAKLCGNLSGHLLLAHQTIAYTLVCRIFMSILKFNTVKVVDPTLAEIDTWNSFTL
jgi:hypothetical protein